jgi:hypothetical protein
LLAQGTDFCRKRFTPISPLLRTISLYFISFTACVCV